MSDLPSPEDDLDHLSTVEREAAEWIVKQSENFSANDEAKLATWLALSPEHYRVYVEMAETSALLDGLKFRLPSMKTAKPTPKRHVLSRRASVWALSGLAASALVVTSILYVRAHRYDDFTDSAVTALGERRQLDLPDGSTVLLNTDSAIEVAFAANERHLRLVRGEAFFTVAKNPRRPFVVEAGNMTVRAVGTAFDVRLRQDALNVLVTEGKVRVNHVVDANSPAPNTPVIEGPILSAGHFGEIALEKALKPLAEALVVSEVEPRSIKNTLAWQEGRLEFSDTTLAEVVAEFNRYNRHQIVITDPELAARRFGGAFASHQSEPFLELLEQSFGVVAISRGDKTEIRLGK